MKKILVSLVLFALAFAFSSSSVLAGGDQNTGDTGIGETAQNCILFFGDCPNTGVNF
jgi:hypothetical protein